MKNSGTPAKRNPNKIGKRKYMLEQIFIEESDEEIELVDTTTKTREIADE